MAPALTRTARMARRRVNCALLRSKSCAAGRASLLRFGNTRTSRAPSSPWCAAYQGHRSHTRSDNLIACSHRDPIAPSSPSSSFATPRCFAHAAVHKRASSLAALRRFASPCLVYRVRAPLLLSLRSRLALQPPSPPSRSLTPSHRAASPPRPTRDGEFSKLLVSLILSWSNAAPTYRRRRKRHGPLMPTHTQSLDTSRIESEPL